MTRPTSRQAVRDVLASPRVTQLRNAVARRLAVAEPASGSQPFSGYGDWWNPADEEHAMQLVLNESDPEVFEQSGRNDAKVIGEVVGADDVVMDVGCGIGRVARYIAPQCAQVWAVDASPMMLSMAQRRLADVDNIRYARCHDTSIPDIPDASVDVAYSVLVLQHLDRDDAFRLLREMRRVLKPGGRAVFTYPNLMDDTYRDAFVRHAVGHDTHPGRARYYTPQEVGRIVPAAGFQIDELVDEVEIRVVCSVAP